MNRDIIEELKGVVESLNSIVEVLEAQKNDCAAPTEKVSKSKSTVKREKIMKDASKEQKTVKGHLCKEDLDDMSYNDLKKLCKSMGIPATGSRDEITEKIIGVEVEAPVEDDTVEEKPAKETKKSTSRKLGKKTVEPEPEPEGEEEKDQVYEDVLAATEDMSTEEIADFLSENGLRAKGKRESLIAELVKAVREGKITLEDDEEGEETGEAEESESEEMTAERAQAIKEKNKEIDELFNDGEISKEDLIEWYCDVFDVKPKDAKKLSEEELLDAYKEAEAAFIDDEGVAHDEKEPYYIGDVPYCCGEKLAYDEETEEYVCEVCGNRYNAD